MFGRDKDAHKSCRKREAALRAERDKAVEKYRRLVLLLMIQKERKDATSH